VHQFDKIKDLIITRACVCVCGRVFLTLQSPLVTVYTNRLKIQKFYLLLTLCIYLFSVYIRIHST